MHWNMGSRQFRRKTDEIRQILSEKSPDLFLISEANLQIETTIEERNIEGYSLITPKTMITYGVARLVALVKDGVQLKVRSDWMEDDTASIWFEINRPGKRKLVVGAIYREHTLPRQPFPNVSDSIPNQIARWNKFLAQWKMIGSRFDTFVVGDTNLDTCRWENPTSNCRQMVENTKDEIVTEGFHQLIQGITRSWRGQTDSCLDQVWTNVLALSISTSNFSRGSSDHNVIQVIIRLKGAAGNCLEFLSRRRGSFDLNRYRDRLKSSSWNDLYSITDPDKANKWLESLLVNILQEECPMRVVQPNKRLKSWIRSETIEIFVERDAARMKAKETDLDADWAKYRKLRNLATSAMKHNKKEHFKELFDNMEASNNTQGLFKTIKSQLGIKSGGPPQSLVIGGKSITAPKKIADAQLSFFNNKVENLITSIPRPTENPLKVLEEAFKRWGVEADRRRIFTLKNVTVGETLSAINKLGNSSAFGHDYIDSISIKSAGDILAEPISYLINLSIQQSRFMKSWKKAKLIPLHKGKGLERSDPGSFRPVAILPAISKVAEKVIHSQIIRFMDESNQLNHNLHGYRTHYSTSTAMLQISDAILRTVDANKISTIVTIDESSAFDCVNAEILDKKLQMYNMDKKTRDWISSYMTERELYVEIGTKKSDTVVVNRGVPQGSVLGPLLFTIYTNELPDVIVQTVCKEPAHKKSETLFPANCNNCGSVPAYADDASCVIETKTRQMSQENVTNITEKMQNFLNSQELSVNIAKTNILESLVKQKRTKLKGTQPQIVTLNDKGEEKVVKPTKYIRLLGVNWEQNLSWNSHISTGEKALLPATRRQLGALKYISGQVPLKSKLLLANSLIVSRIVYAITIWGGTYETNIRKLQAVLNKTAWWVCNSGRRTSSRTLMERCNWLSIRELILYHTVLALWKTIWLKIPLELHMKVNLDTDYIATTREPRLQTCKLGFLWRAVNGWNTLSLEIRSLKSFPRFKKLLRKFIIENRDAVSNLSPQSSPGTMSQTQSQTVVAAQQSGHSSQNLDADENTEVEHMSQSSLLVRSQSEEVGEDARETGDYTQMDNSIHHTAGDMDTSQDILDSSNARMDNQIDMEMDRILDMMDTGT